MTPKNKIILAISVLVGGIFSIFASAFPDGLEKVAENYGFINQAKISFPALIADYAFPKVGYEPLATALAGIFGTILTFLLILFLGKVIIKTKQL
ncbi:MAG: PDGLE domain-containing protein [Candidatus Buchananbacteria bacterium]